MNPPCRRCGGLGEVIESVYGHPTEKVKCHCVQELEEKVSEKSADDGPKFETKFGADIYQARDLRLSVVMNKDIITIEDCEADMITVRVDEWPALRAAIDRLIGECRE